MNTKGLTAIAKCILEYPQVKSQTLSERSLQTEVKMISQMKKVFLHKYTKYSSPFTCYGRYQIVRPLTKQAISKKGLKKSSDSAVQALSAVL